MTPRERYLMDPLFHRLVNVILAELRSGYTTPTEMREALMYAQLLIEERRPRFVPPVGSSTEAIRRWTTEEPKAALPLDEPPTDERK